MKTYLSDNIDIYTDADSIFSHREVSLLHEEKIRIKNALVETVVDNEIKLLSKMEKEYWILYRKGIRNKDIAEQLGITCENCRQIKYRAVKKIEKIAEKLKEKLD